MLRTILSLVILINGLAFVEAQTESAPYIYYPSNSAIIIESADGTDRRIIPDAGVSGEFIWDWSASGQWLAWTGTSYDNDRNPTARIPGAISINGQQVTVLDIFDDAELSWSPEGEYLFAGGIVKNYEPFATIGDLQIYRLALINPAEDRVVAFVDIPLYTPYSPRGESVLINVNYEWVVDGRYLVLMYHESAQSAGEAGMIFQIFDTAQESIITVSHVGSPFVSLPDGQYPQHITSDGLVVFAGDGSLTVHNLFTNNPFMQTIQTPTPVLEIEAIADTQLLIILDNNIVRTLNLAETSSFALQDFQEVNDEPRIHGFSPDSQYIADITRSSPTIENLETGEFVPISPHGRTIMVSDYQGSINWHPGSNWFLAFELPFIPMMGLDFTNVSIIKADGAMRRDIITCFDATRCIQWLPERIDVTQAMPFEGDVLIAEIVMTDTDFVRELIWSPDGQSIASRTRYNNFAIWDIETQMLVNRLEHSTAIDMQVTWAVNEEGHYQASMAETTNLDFHELQTLTSPDGNYLIEVRNDEFDIPFIRIQNQDSGEIIPANIYGYAAAFDPSGEYLAVGSAWEIRIYRWAEIID